MKKKSQSNVLLISLKCAGAKFQSLSCQFLKFVAAVKTKLHFVNASLAGEQTRNQLLKTMEAYPVQKTTGHSCSN